MKRRRVSHGRFSEVQPKAASFVFIRERHSERRVTRSAQPETSPMIVGERFNTGSIGIHRLDDAFELDGRDIGCCIVDGRLDGVAQGGRGRGAAVTAPLAAGAGRRPRRGRAARRRRRARGAGDGRWSRAWPPAHPGRGGAARRARAGSRPRSSRAASRIGSGRVAGRRDVVDEVGQGLAMEVQQGLDDFAGCACAAGSANRSISSIRVSIRRSGPRKLVGSL